MINTSKYKTEMPELSVEIRKHNFDEVSLGYTAKQAITEADRCINCKNPECVLGCPVNVQIPKFIKEIKLGEFKKSYEIISKTNSLPAICGRVCPQERQCEKLCVRAKNGEAVAIGRLERFVADWYLNNQGKTEKTESNGVKAAIIGAGPAGLACAGDLAKLGYDVTIFEAFHMSGGVLMYGIPEFRLPKMVVKKEIDSLKQLGVKIILNTVIGKLFNIDELFDKGYKTIYICTGAGLPRFLGIQGEDLNGVYSSNEFLTRINLMKAYDFPNSDTPIKVGKSVAIVGGGNVAMDAARCAKRLGAEEVCIIYRRSETEMPARLEEVDHAKEEGICFKL